MSFGEACTGAVQTAAMMEAIDDAVPSQDCEACVAAFVWAVGEAAKLLAASRTYHI